MLLVTSRGLALGRHPSHTFIDYGIFYLITAWTFCFALGQSGDPVPGVPNIFDQIHQDNGKCVAIAICGGFILSIGNICLQYSVALLGLSVGLPFICALTIVVGVSLNYKLDSGLNNAAILFPGCACAFVAIMVGGLAHIENQTFQQKKKRQELGDVSVNSSADMELVTGPSKDPEAAVKDVAPADTLPAGTPALGLRDAEFLSIHNSQRSIKAGAKQWWLGIIFAGIAGLCISLFSPAFNVASNDSFNLLPPGVPNMSVYLTNFWFALGFAIGAVGINLVLLYFPPLEGTPKSSIMAFIKDWRLRPLAMLAGFFCSAGNLAEFIGGQAAGYAAAAMVQAFPLVATLWGILLFREFWGTSRRAVVLLVFEVAFYIAAMALLGASAKSRATA